MMGSFDAGYGTWYLEDLVGKKKAKEMWYCNIKISAAEALEMGLVNRVVPDDRLAEATREFALEVAAAMGAHGELVVGVGVAGQVADAGFQVAFRFFFFISL